MHICIAQGQGHQCGEVGSGEGVIGDKLSTIKIKHMCMSRSTPSAEFAALAGPCEWSHRRWPPPELLRCPPATQFLGKLPVPASAGVTQLLGVVPGSGRWRVLFLPRGPALASG